VVCIDGEEIHQVPSVLVIPEWLLATMNHHVPLVTNAQDIRHQYYQRLKAMI